MRPFRWLVFTLLALGSAAIAWSSLVYFDDTELPPFLIEKLPLPNEDLWLGAVKVHVAAAAFALPACLILFSALLQRRAPAAHRWLGRLVGAVILLALVPSGFYLALFARGGLPSTVGFMLSGAIVAVSMVRAITAARARDFAAHRRFTLHVLAQLGVAVVSRAMLYAADAVALDPERAYVASLWLPVIAGVVVAELLAPKSSRRKNHAPLSDARPAHVGQPGLVRARA